MWWKEIIARAQPYVDMISKYAEIRISADGPCWVNDKGIHCVTDRIKIEFNPKETIYYNKSYPTYERTIKYKGDLEDAIQTVEEVMNYILKDLIRIEKKHPGQKSLDDYIF